MNIFGFFENSGFSFLFFKKSFLNSKSLNQTVPLQWIIETLEYPSSRHSLTKEHRPGPSLQYTKCAWLWPYSFWKVLDGPELDGPEMFCKNCQKVSIKFGQFSNPSTSYPKIAPKIRIAPLRVASGIEILIFW